MKKTILLIPFVIIILIGCFKQINIHNVVGEPNFSGTVKEVSKESILVLADEKEDEIKSSDLMSVSLDVLLKEELVKVKVGDIVKVYYDGVITETYPAQINNVYIIIILD